MEAGSKKEYSISAAGLKWIAVITMMIDHFAAAVYRQLGIYDSTVYDLMRAIGRIAFPIYCFLLVEGFCHTRSVRNYIKNCFLFAIFSEIPFDLAIFGCVYYPWGQNVFFTLAIGLCALWVLDQFKGQYAIRDLLIKAAVIVLFAYLGQTLEVDYHWRGILFIILFYYCRNLEKWKRNMIGACAFVTYELTAPLAFIPIQFYNGKRGKQNKYLFYAIYPIHLLIYGLIRMYLEQAG